MIKIYYKNGDSATYRALRGDCGSHNRPTTRGIGKIVKKFDETGVVTNIERSVHHHCACSAEIIAIISENITEDQNVSMCNLPHILCHN